MSLCQSAEPGRQAVDDLALDHDAVRLQVDRARCCCVIPKACCEARSCLSSDWWSLYGSPAPTSASSSARRRTISITASSPAILGSVGTCAGWSIHLDIGYHVLYYSPNVHVGEALIAQERRSPDALGDFKRGGGAISKKLKKTLGSNYFNIFQTKQVFQKT